MHEADVIRCLAYMTNEARDRLVDQGRQTSNQRANRDSIAAELTRFAPMIGAPAEPLQSTPIVSAPPEDRTDATLRALEQQQHQAAAQREQDERQAQAERHREVVEHNKDRQPTSMVDYVPPPRWDGFRYR